MKIKKILFTVLLLLVLTGCSENNSIEQNVDADITQNESIENTAVKNENDEVVENDEVGISLGTWEGSVYTNDFLNLTYNLPQNWVKYSDEEIAEIMNLGAEIVTNGNEFLKEVSKLTSVYYIFTQDLETNNNVSVYSEKVVYDFDVEYYLTQVKNQLESLTDINYVIGENSSANIDGVEYTTLDVSVAGLPILQKYYVRKQGKYFVGIIATSMTGEEGITEIMECFN